MLNEEIVSHSNQVKIYFYFYEVFFIFCKWKANFFLRVVFNFNQDNVAWIVVQVLGREVNLMQWDLYKQYIEEDLY